MVFSAMPFASLKAKYVNVQNILSADLVFG